jgi:hypothetical protein
MPPFFCRQQTRTRPTGPTRGWLEHGFGQDFGEVRLHIWSAGFPWPRARACTIGAAVHIRERDYQPDTPFGRNLLAHEFAHIVQKRLPLRERSDRLRSGARVRRLEAEAAAAAGAVVAGRRVRCRVVDEPTVPRFWGFAGHYYTVYFVLLAAGIDNLTAARMAFYSQMPDQVKELAATSAGIDLFATLAKSKVLNVFDHSKAMARAERVTRDYEVQEGLHCLTGGSSTAETNIRGGRLRSLPFGSFAFGIALHPYGDSFAHRQLHHGELMYDPGIGHALDGHCPDHIQERRDLYLQYVEGLYDIVAARTPHRERRLERLSLMARILEITSIGGDAAQGAKMREIAARDMSRVMNAYRPEYEKATSWTHFREQHPELSGHLLEEALALAHLWATA